MQPENTQKEIWEKQNLQLYSKKSTYEPYNVILEPITSLNLNPKVKITNKNNKKHG